MDAMQTTRIAGAIALTTGIVLTYIISRRKFNRRTITGSEVFRNYERSQLIPPIEKVGRFIAWILILGGILLIILASA